MNLFLSIAVPVAVWLILGALAARWWDILNEGYPDYGYGYGFSVNESWRNTVTTLSFLFAPLFFAAALVYGTLKGLCWFFPWIGGKIPAVRSFLWPTEVKRERAKARKAAQRQSDLDACNSLIKQAIDMSSLAENASDDAEFEILKLAAKGLRDQASAIAVRNNFQAAELVSLMTPSSIDIKRKAAR